MLFLSRLCARAQILRSSRAASTLAGIGNEARIFLILD